DKRAARRVEDLEVIAAGFGSRAVFRRDPDLRQIDNRRRHEELMRLRDQFQLLLLRAKLESLFDRSTGYIDHQVFGLTRSHHEDERRREQYRDAKPGRASAPQRDRGVASARISGGPERQHQAKAVGRYRQNREVAKKESGAGFRKQPL